MLDDQPLAGERRADLGEVERNRRIFGDEAQFRKRCGRADRLPGSDLHARTRRGTACRGMPCPRFPTVTWPLNMRHRTYETDYLASGSLPFSLGAPPGREDEPDHRAGQESVLVGLDIDAAKEIEDWRQHAGGQATQSHD